MQSSVRGFIGGIWECNGGRSALCEDSSLLPCSPYAVARVAQEMLSHVYADSYGVDIVMTRSFNHIGPWQDTRFVVPGFIAKIWEIKKAGKGQGMIETGDLSIIRDFVDVRDVVRAYYDLLLHGRPGELYNVCSGVGNRLSDIVDKIARILEIDIDTVVNPEYIRLMIIILLWDPMKRSTGISGGNR